MHFNYLSTATVTRWRTLPTQFRLLEHKVLHVIEMQIIMANLTSTILTITNKFQNLLTMHSNESLSVCIQYQNH